MLRNYNLTHVENGHDALEYVKKGDFDLVLMDVMMPIMDGVKATKEIRKFNRNIPIVAITANAFESDRAAALEAGCNAFLTKPINKAEVLEEIEKLIKNRKLDGIIYKSIE